MLAALKALPTAAATDPPQARTVRDNTLAS